MKSMNTSKNSMLRKTAKIIKKYFVIANPDIKLLRSIDMAIPANKWFVDVKFDTFHCKRRLGRCCV